MTLFADIATGNTATADVLFLIAVILAVLAAVVAYVAPELPAGKRVAVGWLSVAAAALGWLIL